jgi:hypothetical protein
VVPQTSSFHCSNRSLATCGTRVTAIPPNGVDSEKLLFRFAFSTYNHLLFGCQLHKEKQRFYYIYFLAV